VVISFSKGEHVFFDDYFCKEVIFIFSEGLWSCVGDRVKESVWIWIKLFASKNK
jgi:hypothetical protein